MSLNRVVLIGRLTKDPELRYSKNGTGLCNFTIAVNRTFDKDNTDFLRIVCFKKQAENLATYMKRGDQLGVDGRISTRSYEKDGVKQYMTEIVAEQIHFLNKTDRSKNGDEHKQVSSDSNYDDPFADGKPIDISDSDLPF